MSLYTSVLEGVAGFQQKYLPGTIRPEKTAAGRVGGFFKDVVGTMASGYRVSPQGGVAFEEEERSAKLYSETKEAFDTASSSLTQERNTQVTAQKKRSAEGGYDIKTGPGTFAGTLGKSGGPQHVPEEIPEAPTGPQLAKMVTKEKMAEELQRMIKNGYLPERSKAGGMLASGISGLTMGVLSEDFENPLTIAQYREKPITGAEQVGRVGSQVVGAIPTYVTMAKTIGAGVQAVGPQALRAVAAENPLFWNAVVLNGGQELVEMGVRKGTGQEYGTGNFVMGMMFGGAVDGLRFGVLKNVDAGAVRKQINDAVGTLSDKTGKIPTMDEVYTHLRDNLVPGTNTTYRTAFAENRLMHYREKTPNIGVETEGRLARLTGPEKSGEPPIPKGDVPAKTPAPSLDEDAAISAIKEDALTKNLSDQDLELASLADGQYQSYVQNLPAYKRAWEGVKYVTNRLSRIRLLESYGQEGKTISRKMLNANYDETITIAKDLREVNSLPKITDQEAQNVGEHLFTRGQKALETPGEQAWASWYKNYMVTAAREQVALGMTVKDPATGKAIGQVKPDTYYIPHKVSPENEKLFAGWLRKYGMDKQTKSIQITETVARKVMAASKGKITSVDQAMRILRFQRMRPGMRAAHLELARSDIHGIPKEFLETDVRKILQSYMPEYRKRTSWVKEFGAQGKYGEKLDSLLKEANGNGRDVASMKQIVENVTGLSQAAVEKTGAFNPGVTTLSSKIRAFEAGTKLSPLTTVTNISDVAKAFGITGRVIPTLRSVVSGFLGKTVPAAMDMNIKGLTEDLGDGLIENIAKKSLKYGGFEFSERGVRGTVHRASVADAEIIVKRLSKMFGKGKSMSDIKDPGTFNRIVNENVFGTSYRRLLKYMEPEQADAAIKRGGLTAAEKELIGTRMVFETQPIAPQDVPYYANTPLGRIPYQFKTFAIKTSSFLNRHIIKEAKAGNFRPAVSFFIAAQTFGEASADARAFLIGKKRNEKIGPRMLENMMQIGGVGLVTDVLSSIMYGNYGGGLYKWLAGPFVSEVVDTLGLLREKTLQDAAAKLGKNQIRNVPYAGSFLKEGFMDDVTGFEGFNPSKNEQYSPGFPIPFKENFTGGEPEGTGRPSIPRPKVPKPPKPPRPPRPPRP